MRYKKFYQRRKPAVSDKLSMCAGTLHQLGTVGNMMDLNNYANLSSFSPATLFCWAKTPSEEYRYDCQHQNRGIHRLTAKTDLRLIKR